MTQQVIVGHYSSDVDRELEEPVVFGGYQLTGRSAAAMRPSSQLVDVSRDNGVLQLGRFRHQMTLRRNSDGEGVGQRKALCLEA